MSLALARKYRPATFDDLIGQESVSQTLSLALDGNRLSHAYLFSGLRGSGKTSTARIFAKALLCETGTTSHPCGTCAHCIMAAENRHMDIIEMDAASTRGIDDIKDLIEHTKYKPSSARYKIFIIDEVHMLTTQAFNALLKTLEEPPDFVKFILATTDPLKLPATILSRTQHFRFKKIPQNFVLKHLEHIMAMEDVGYEREALEIIARSGAGSLRDSLTLLDQAIVYSKNHVDVATVTGMLGIIEPSLLDALLNDILRKDQTKILAFIKLASDYEAEMILDELTLYLKELLLNQNSKFSPMIIERFFRVIADSKGLLSLGSDGEFVLTLALFKMMEALEIKEIDMMIRSLEKELQGVEVTEIMVTTETSKETTPSEVITITEEDIVAPSIVREKKQEEANSIEKNNREEPKIVEKNTPEQNIAEEVIAEEAISKEDIAKKEVIIESVQNLEPNTISMPPLTNEMPVMEEAPNITPSIEQSNPQTIAPNQESITADASSDAVTENSAYINENLNIENESYENTQEVTPNIVKTPEEIKPIEPKSPKAKSPKFNELLEKIYDRSFELGECFKNSIEFVSFENGKLTWNSSAEGEEKKQLITHWGLINMFVKELFGYETKIVNISKKKTVKPEIEAPKVTVDTPRVEENRPLNTPQVSNNEPEMKSSCIAPEAGETEAAKEKDPSTLLEEPMIKEAIALFNPKKVRIKKNV